MKLKPKKTPFPIGLEIGSGHVRMLQFQADNDGALRVAAEQRPLPSDIPADGDARNDVIVPLIQQMLGTGRFTGRQVVSCAAGIVTEYRNIRIAPMPAAEMKSAVQWQAANRLELSGDEHRFEMIDAGEIWEGEDKLREIIVLAGSHKAIDEHVSILTRCKLQPLAIDSVPGALARCLASAQDDDAEQAAQIVLNIGYESSTAVMIDGDAIRFARRLAVGSRQWDERAAEQLSLSAEETRKLRAALRDRGENAEPKEPWPWKSVSPDEARKIVQETGRTVASTLARELTSCVRYYSVTFRQRRPETGVLVGAEAHEADLASVLAAKAAVEFKPAHTWPAVDLDLDEALDLGAGAAPLWSVAAGLGLHEVAHDGAKNADVNGADFLPETFAAAEAGRKSTFHYAAVLCVALVLMLAWYVFGGRELREMKHRLATLGPQVAGAHERRNTLAQLEKEKSQLSVQAATYRKVAPPLTTTSVIAVIGDLIPSSLALKALSVSSPPAQPKAPQSKDKAHRKRKKTEIQPIEPMKLDLVGLASTDLDVARFERRLVEHELFSHVKLIFSRPIEIGELAAREFRIEAQTPLDRRYVQAGTEQEVAHAD